MFPIFQWICFWLISDSESVYRLTHALIGNYKTLNPKDCGISYLSIGFSDICYKWHKNPLSLLKEGRDALPYEVPWFATIKVRYNPRYDWGYCGGTLIANQWIITAKHCCISNTISDYYIQFGTGPIITNDTPKFSITEIHNATDSGTDLGLLKLKHPVNSSSFGFPVNSICLPEPNIIHKDQEFALTVGRGQIEPQQSAQVGYLKIITDYTGIPFDEDPDYKWMNKSHMLFTTPPDNQTLLCHGDSGGPAWQFNNGRAVLIGALSTGGLLSGEHCGGFGDIRTMYGGFTRVAPFIEWIKNVTKLN